MPTNDHIWQQRPPATMPIMLMVVGIGIAVVISLTTDTTGGIMGLMAIPLFAAFAGWLMLVFRSRLRIDTAQRCYWWHPGPPWLQGLESAPLDADLQGIHVAQTPCAGKRQCLSGYAITLRFQSATGDVEVARYHVREDAEDAASTLAEQLGTTTI